MKTVIEIPDIQSFVEPLLGRPYDDYDCWNLVRHLYQAGFGFDLVRDTQSAASRFQEVWSRQMPADVLTILQPWDLLVFAQHDELPVTDHVGIALDAQQFVHARQSTTGVALGRIRTWKSRLFQVARLRELL
jgi:cell wall-associated NlpC family hydrolase